MVGLVLYLLISSSPLVVLGVATEVFTIASDMSTLLRPSGLQAMLSVCHSYNTPYHIEASLVFLVIRIKLLWLKSHPLALSLGL